MSDSQGMNSPVTHEAEVASVPSSPPMSKRARLLLGVLTFWPPFYIVVFMLLVLGSVALAALGHGDAAPPAFVALVFIHILTMFEIIGLTIYYAVNVYREPAIQGDRKILWMVIVLLGGFIGQAVYYVMWIVKRSPSVLGSTPAATRSVAQERP